MKKNLDIQLAVDRVKKFKQLNQRTALREVAGNLKEARKWDGQIQYATEKLEMAEDPSTPTGLWICQYGMDGEE